MKQDPPSRVGRRLAAIVAADVAGYSRLMGLDEVGTARTLREHRKVTDALVAKHGGRLVKSTGDGVLLEFPSVVDAVECAVAIQAAMFQRNYGVPADRQMLLRIGINLGDILIEGEDILGDGVNIAARLESIAKPGAICISSSAHEQVRGKVACEFADIGPQMLKNIEHPVWAYTLMTNPLSEVGGAQTGRPSAPRLSIVVLPFANIGGDAEQEYFVDGITESLTTDLSRISGAFVIARNTAFTFKGRAVDVKKIGSELNVRYVLEGSVQRSGNRMRVNVQLIDAETANHLWAERFDKPVADLFDMQDEIVSRLANTLGAQLIAAEARRAETLAHPDVMDLCFQGTACRNRGPGLEDQSLAKRFYERALALEPKNVEALVGLAQVDATTAGSFLTDNRGERFAAAEANLIKALSLAPEHAWAHMLLGFIQISTNRAAQGIAECEQALVLDRNLAGAYGWMGIAKVYMGRPEETEEHIQHALRLSPRDPGAYRWVHFVGVAKSELNDDAEALQWLRRGVELNRNYAIGHFHLAAALARLGRLDEARAAAQAGMTLDPAFTVRRMRSFLASDNPIYLAWRERVYDGMRRAGLPEG